jgi:hypothetical protein
MSPTRRRVLAAVAGHLTRDDTLTVGRAVRLAGQFRRSRAVGARPATPRAWDPRPC